MSETANKPPPDQELVATDQALVATGSSNPDSREALTRLAEEQAALRRIATLVARGSSPAEVFVVLSEELRRLLECEGTGLLRFEADGTATLVAVSDAPWETPPLGTRIPLDGENLITQVLHTGRVVRADDWTGATGAVAAIVEVTGTRSLVAAPVVVEGRSWGATVAATSQAEPLPPATEERLERFTELVATAIANATARAELLASRARIVAAADEARRRIERNLHDGVQQGLLALILDVQRAQAAPDGESSTRATLQHVEQDLETILEDLREISHGLHPPLLSRLGLGPSVEALARRSPIPVHLEVDLPERPRESLETALYYAVSESMTNALKHSHASALSVTIRGGDKLQALIVDDGVGGADADGSGLVGLRDRVDALGGHLALDSPPSGGTKISIEFPMERTVAY